MLVLFIFQTLEPENQTFHLPSSPLFFQLRGSSCSSSTFFVAHLVYLAPSPLTSFYPKMSINCRKETEASSCSRKKESNRHQSHPSEASSSFGRKLFCKCGRRAVVLTSYTKKNKHRKFFRCPFYLVRCLLLLTYNFLLVILYDKDQIESRST